MEISLAGALIIAILIFEIFGTIKRKEIENQNEYIIALLESKYAKEELKEIKEELEEMSKKEKK